MDAELEEVTGAVEPVEDSVGLTGVIMIGTLAPVDPELLVGVLVDREVLAVLERWFHGGSFFTPATINATSRPAMTAPTVRPFRVRASLNRI